MNIKEESLLIVLFCLVISTVATALVFSLFVYVLTGCWPINRVGIDNCWYVDVRSIVRYLPLLIGVLIGSVWSIKLINKQDRVD